MIKKEFKEQLYDLVQTGVDGLDTQGVINMTRGLLLQIEKDIEYEQSNRNKSWTDEELRVVLSFPPTKENALKLAKAFKRNYGSIEQIFRWATTDNKEIKEKGRDEDSFIRQIKRIHKEMGWRA